MDASDEEPTEFGEAARDALHSVELGLEWLQRAHGNLLEFHHGIGHGMNHLDDAEAKLRDCGHEELADRLRDDYLPRGPIDGRWTYELVEDFEAEFLDDLAELDRRAHEAIADGERHLAEQHQRREWERRARDR